ncbi:MAG TPA: GNAT family N-acetyltransferase [Acidimicrobiales bacterium]|nr:GNAT family N-acetyltransferase [Acidimicrobiales bacterium]
MAGDIEVVEATTVDQELVDGWARLVGQLSSSAPPPGRDELGEITASPATVLFVARLDGRMVGSLTLVLFRIPTGMRAIIEDVVTDEAVRGRGVGSALTRAALDRAGAAGCRSVDLTSRPSREAANRLYQQLGFKRRETNVYRYDG